MPYSKLFRKCNSGESWLGGIIIRALAGGADSYGHAGFFFPENNLIGSG
jgi:hypothetical protein